MMLPEFLFNEPDDPPRVQPDAIAMELKDAWERYSADDGNEFAVGQLVVFKKGFCPMRQDYCDEPVLIADLEIKGWIPVVGKMGDRQHLADCVVLTQISSGEFAFLLADSCALEPWPRAEEKT